jgi:hypothetical protein
MLTCDWVERHEWLDRLARRRPSFVIMIEEFLSPDQALWGSSTGQSPDAVIALPNRKKRQAVLEEFGFRKKLRT